MRKPTYPHYFRLRNILNKRQLEIYYKLTPNISFSAFFDFNTITVIKNTDNVLVMLYKNNIVKVVFVSNNVYKSEVYYSHTLYEVDIYSLAVLEGCILFLPVFGENLRDSKLDKDDMNILKHDLLHQISHFHSIFIVHHDIKPSNIVKNTNDEYDMSWKIIDFGLTKTHEPSEPGYLPVRDGTYVYNIPKYNLVKCSELQKLFWIYMKDWYGFAKTLEEYGDKDIHVLYNYIDSMQEDKIITLLIDLFERYNVPNIPFYLQNQNTDTKQDE